MSIVQDPGCRNDGRAWSRFIGTVVEVLSRCVVLVRPCNKGSKLSRPHGIMVEVFLTDAETSWLDVECRYGTTMPWGPARAAPAVPGVMALCHQTVFPIPTQRLRSELMTCFRQILRFFASALSRLNIRIDWPQTPQMQGASGENRVRRPLEPMRRRRWGVCGQPCGAGARRPWALALVVNVCSHTLSSSLRAHNPLALRQS